MPTRAGPLTIYHDDGGMVWTISWVTYAMQSKVSKARQRTWVRACLRAVHFRHLVLLMTQDAQNA